jgi:hypothetical protein
MSPRTMYTCCCHLVAAHMYPVAHFPLSSEGWWAARSVGKPKAIGLRFLYLWDSQGSKDILREPGGSSAPSLQ